MPQHFVVIDGVKYVLDADRRTLRTKPEVEASIALVQRIKREFNAPQDAELVRLNELLSRFPE